MTVWSRPDFAASVSPASEAAVKRYSDNKSEGV